MISFEVKGLSALEQQLTELGTELAVKTLAKAARRAFKPVLDTALSMVPRDSGALANSLKLTTSKPKEGAVVVVGISIGRADGKRGELPPARRWHFVELGTAKMQAHPFLRPALDTNANAVLEGLKEELRKAIEQAIRKRAGGR